MMDLGEQADRVKFVIRDRGSNFTAAFDAVLADAGIRTVLCNIQPPRRPSHVPAHSSSPAQPPFRSHTGSSTGSRAGAIPVIDYLRRGEALCSLWPVMSSARRGCRRAVPAGVGGGR